MNEVYLASLKSSFTAHWGYMALRAACKLNLFDQLLQEPTSTGTLSRSMELDARTLETLCSFLLREGYLYKEDERYGVSDKGLYFTDYHPERVKYSCILWGEEQLTALQSLDYCIRTGDSSFESHFGDSFFGYISSRPEVIRIYHKAMEEYAREDYRNLTQLVDFSSFHSVLDAGGGTGTLAGYVKAGCPDVEVTVLDRPEVLALSEMRGGKLLPGDFFQPVTGRYDAIVLARVLHDWSDELALQILENVSHAQVPGDSLLVLENLIDRMPDRGELLSLHMTAVCRSFERSFEEYSSLLNKSGYMVNQPIRLTPHQFILPCKKN